ncbi:DUF6678 family protein [Sporosarcina limicola]|uniref:Uncharacterized protein n=1 Tax=Sporosarcina limicola TaxID=34101 RepID=A0A927MMR5_9BACL|nr:DUF6678 family protein [Sporosarcina limicola]MBE1556851.1 hypothetical protein [Sporosarcina limicola]
MEYKDFQPVMNNTKWEEIRLVMYNYHLNLLWRTKDVVNNNICEWDNEWYYHFSEDGYETIEWLEIKTEDEMQKNDVIKILRKINVPGEINDNIIKVYGYIKSNEYVDYL